jgi:coproporphyrinogen III oxidase-like Fe-S oxidoreductase
LYCDFNSCSNNELQDVYTDELINEIEKIDVKKFETIFVGGGTPTILSLSNLNKLLNALRKFDAYEYTFESNPGTISEKKLSLLKANGVNRLSIGLQAWQDSLLMNPIKALSMPFCMRISGMGLPRFWRHWQLRLFPSCLSAWILCTNG